MIDGYHDPYQKLAAQVLLCASFDADRRWGWRCERLALPGEASYPIAIDDMH